MTVGALLLFVSRVPVGALTQRCRLNTYNRLRNPSYCSLLHPSTALTGTSDCWEALNAHGEWIQRVYDECVNIWDCKTTPMGCEFRETGASYESRTSTLRVTAEHSHRSLGSRHACVGMLLLAEYFMSPCHTDVCRYLQTDSEPLLHCTATILTPLPPTRGDSVDQRNQAEHRVATLGSLDLDTRCGEKNTHILIQHSTTHILWLCVVECKRLRRVIGQKAGWGVLNRLQTLEGWLTKTDM